MTAAEGTENGPALRQALQARLARCEAKDGWKALAEAGVLGICIPEENGGLGLPLSDVAPVFEVLGDRCLPTRFLESSIVAVSLLKGSKSERAKVLLERLCNPKFVIAITGIEPQISSKLELDEVMGATRISGEALLVLDGAEADVVLALVRTPGRITLVEVPRDSHFSLKASYPTIDGRMAADLEFEAAGCSVLSEDCSPWFEETFDAALACISIEAAAIMLRLVEDTAEYVRQRKQFGQSIGSFQAVQHRLVDMYIAARRAAAISQRAITECSGKTDRASAIASAAKATVAEAGRFVGQQAVQLHGAMGLTDELSIGRCFKRLTVIEQQLGDRDTHVMRFAKQERG